MRYVGGVERAILDHDILKALAQVPDRLAVESRELATELGESVQSVAPRLRPLVRAGLVSKHWGTRHARACAYMITEHGRNYLARVADGTERALQPDERGVQNEAHRPSGFVAAKSALISPPSETPMIAARSDPTASITARTASMRSSRVGS